MTRQRLYSCAATVSSVFLKACDWRIFEFEYPLLLLLVLNSSRYTIKPLPTETFPWFTPTWQPIITILFNSWLYLFRLFILSIFFFFFASFHHHLLLLSHILIYHLTGLILLQIFSLVFNTKKTTVFLIKTIKYHHLLFIDFITFFDQYSSTVHGISLRHFWRRRRLFCFSVQRTSNQIEKLNTWADCVFVVNSDMWKWLEGQK